MRNLCLCLFACILLPLSGLAQPAGIALKVFNLINAARTDPAAFLQAHGKEIQAYNPRHFALLQKAKPITPVAWDPGLAAMSRSYIESKNLNPTYKGKQTLCSYAGGYREGEVEQDPLYYVCEYYTNVHDPAYAHLGMYFLSNHQGYACYWGTTCDQKKIPYSFTGRIDSSKVNFASINAAKNTAYLTDAEKRMVLEVNFLRAYPQVYADVVRKYLHDESLDDGGLDQDTYDAGLELMAELDTMKPRAILQPMECVYNAAKLHGLDCKQRGFFAHEGSNGSDPWDRILKQCPALEFGNENGAMNAETAPRMAVIQLLLDDGISDRGHRYNMLDPTWRYVGCYRYVYKKTAYYTAYQWVQNFAR